MAAPRQITIFDTLSDQKRPLETIEPGKVGMYVCGVTVYDYTHIGHARVYIFFDVVARFLRSVGYEVQHVRNHTDVDDKIIKRAAETGEEPLALSQRFIEAFDEDMAALGVQDADVAPKVSEHIDQIIAMVEKLIERGYAYEAGGDVYYRVEKFDGYGKLSHRKLEDMEAGRSGRVDADNLKEHPFDFALWKGGKDGEISWDSPWGEGRPGWHIECSAMSTEYLGATFDIHGGGRDLIFPHHENEIAQSEGACGVDFVNYWMHIGMVNVAERDDSGQTVERKMSKSLGNFWTTRDVLQGYHPEAIRFFMLTTHYRNPITYSVDNLEEATQRLDYFYTALQRVDATLARAGFDAADNPPPQADWEEAAGDVLESFGERLEEALADDFNTPRALAVLGDAAKIANELTESKKKPSAERAWTIYRAATALRGAGNILGLFEREAGTALRELRDLRVKVLELDADAIEAKIVARGEARANKDWAAADSLRDELLEMGVEIMDSPEGTTWRLC